ncbi:WXG100 family type VII secretion target [Kitasatospora sp. NPDC057015]|uniref:WXG100 family type VII secretion target n=1 Tax=Kitasatospora sp. NPDC057015 TaxID=3346001 RepID=UPI00362CA8E3
MDEQLGTEQARTKRLAGSEPGAGGGGAGFQVDPELYLAAVSPVLAASDQLAQLVNGLTAFLDHTHSTAPWGNDESGKHFAEGDKGYLKYSTETLKGLKGMPDAVRYIADGLKAMAENYRATEDSTAGVLRDDEDDSIGVPQVPGYSPAAVDPTVPSAAMYGSAAGRPHTTGRA